MAREERDEWLAQADLVAHTPHTVTSRKTFAAEVKAAGTEGYAATENQFEVGLRGIAVPLANRAGTVVGAIGVSMATSSCTSDEATRRYVPALKRAADALMDLI